MAESKVAENLKSRPYQTGQRACGCHVALHAPGRAEVIYCATHGAGSETAQALRRLLPFAETEIKRRKWSQNIAAELARSAASKARALLARLDG